MSFVTTFEPMLKDCAQNISDEEARNKCSQSLEQLAMIKKQATARSAESAGLVNTVGWSDAQGIRELLCKGLGVKAAKSNNKGKKGKAAASAPTQLKWPAAGVAKPTDASAVVDFAVGVACSMLDERCDDLQKWSKALSPLLLPLALNNGKTAKTVEDALATVVSQSQKTWRVAEVDDDDDAETLCDTTFTLAFGSKILLHNTKMKLKRGHKYGLVGQSDCGKTSLLRAIANEQIDGFPDFSEVRTTFLEADIAEELSNMTCVEYVMADERIKSMGIGEDAVREALNSVGFVAKKDGRYAAQDDEVNTLSGGWRMKVALARGMLHKADILLMDEPTNHLDVINVQWVLEYLKGLKNVTAIMVSTHKQLLTDVAQTIISIDKLKLNFHKGNLDKFVEAVPTAKSYFEIAATKFKMKFPNPSFIEGIKSKGKALMKMKNVEFTYPVNDTPTLFDITVQTSLSSRVACVGRNGAGKSTMVKLLTGELEASKGDCWQHPGCRCAYVAQHAFHHIENHQEKTANEYIRWRYQYGEDREAVVKKTMVVSDEEQKLMDVVMKYETVAQNGAVTVSKRIVKRLTNLRRKDKKSGQYEYEVVWTTDKGASMPNTWERAARLVKHAKGFEKLIKVIDTKEAAKEGMYQRPLTQKNVEQHLEDVGLDAEFGTHNRISSLSGGQKVKVVIAAAMWNQPHIVILDEPTNYLDRESLGALAHAIQEFEGGVVIISHNDDFCSKLCKETWVLELGHLDCKGDAEWMKKAEEAAVNQTQLTEMVDGGGNTIKLKAKGKSLSRKQRKQLEKTLKEMQAAGEDTYDIEEQLGYFDEAPAPVAAK
jgi:elongation factor 3